MRPGAIVLFSEQHVMGEIVGKINPDLNLANQQVYVIPWKCVWSWDVAYKDLIPAATLMSEHILTGLLISMLLDLIDLSSLTLI